MTTEEKVANLRQQIKELQNKNNDSECKKGDYIITTYDDEKLEYYKYNGYKAPTKHYSGGERESHQQDRISISNLSRQTMNFRHKFMNYDLSDKHTMLVTLTTDKKKAITIEQLNTYSESFNKRVKRTFGDNIWFRRIEANKDDDFYHVHFIYAFDEDVSRKFTKKWIQETWTYGGVDKRKIKYTRGLGYISKDNRCDEDRDNFYYVGDEKEFYSKFEAGTHIITHSRNIPVHKEVKQFHLDEEDKNKLVRLMNELSILETDEWLYDYAETAKYIDKETGEVITYNRTHRLY